jgi:hypothetical protein
MKNNLQIKALLSLIVFFFTLSTYAQKDPIKWGKVSDKMLEMTQYEADTSAAAVVVADFATLDFDFSSGEARYVFHRHKRIKILKRSAFKYADITIPFYKEDKIASLKAQTITPDGESHKIKKSDMYEEERSENVNNLKFSFPQLTEGAIIEYEYSLNSGYFFNLEEWYFQDEIPVLHSEYRLAIPEWYNYIFLTQGRSPDIAENETASRNLRVPTMKARREVAHGAPTSVVTTNTITTDIVYYRYVMKDVPAFKEEAYMTTANDHLARLRLQLQSIKYPNSIEDRILSNWPAVAKELDEHEHFGKQYHQKRKFKKLMEDIQPVLDKGETNDEKALLAYQFITSNMEWNGVFSEFTNSSLDECYEKRSGNSGELNLMLLAVLKHIGVEAYPLLISTRGHGKMLTLYPIMSQFNHVLVAASIGGGFQIMDAGNSLRPVGLPRVTALNGKAWLADPANPQWIDLTPPTSNATEMYDLKLTPEGELTYTAKYKYEGYDAVDYRYSFAKKEGEKMLLESIQEELPEATVENIEYNEEAPLSSPLEVNFSGQVSELATPIQQFIYLTPTIHPTFTENPFKLEERAYPVNFPYPFAEQRLVFVNIPEGYSVEELPKSIRLNLPNSGGKFEYLVNQAGAKVSIITKMEISQLVYQPEEYETIKNFFNLILEKQGEQLVFVKKT